MNIQGNNVTIQNGNQNFIGNTGNIDMEVMLIKKNPLQYFGLNVFAGGYFAIYENNHAELVEFGSGVPVIMHWIGKLEDEK